MVLCFGFIELFMYKGDWVIYEVLFFFLFEIGLVDIRIVIFSILEDSLCFFFFLVDDKKIIGLIFLFDMMVKWYKFDLLLFVFNIILCIWIDFCYVKVLLVENDKY